MPSTNPCCKDGRMSLQPQVGHQSLEACLGSIGVGFEIGGDVSIIVEGARLKEQAYAI